MSTFALNHLLIYLFSFLIISLITVITIFTIIFLDISPLLQISNPSSFNEEYPFDDITR